MPWHVDTLALTFGASTQGLVPVEIRRRAPGDPDHGSPCHRRSLRIADLDLEGLAGPSVDPARLAPGEAETLGAAWFSALFAGEGETLLAAAWHGLAEHPRRRLQVQLHFDADAPHHARLAQLPWEILFWPREGFFLVRERRISLQRHLLLRSTHGVPAAGGPRRLLAMGASPRDRAALDLQDELAAVETSWRAMGHVFQVLRPATREALRQRLLKHEVHVLHVMGHGLVDSRGRGCLMLERADGLADAVDADALADIVRGVGNHLRLVVLNTCLSAAATDDDGWTHLAGTLLRAGVPAVIAMQSAVFDLEAVAFSEAFYRRLAAGDPVDVALSETRHGLADRFRDGSPWLAPVLWRSGRHSETRQHETSQPETRQPETRQHETSQHKTPQHKTPQPRPEPGQSAETTTTPTATASLLLPPYPDTVGLTGYLDWLQREMHTLGMTWHASPVVDTPAHLRQPLGWFASWSSRKPRLFRHDTNDYQNNPALREEKIRHRAAFGRRRRIRNLARELRRFSPIVVLGEPGSGKSVCLRQLVMDLARRRGRHDTIPIYLDMGTYDAHDADGRPLPVLDFLRRSLRHHPATRDAEVPYLSWLADHLLPLLNDGRLTCVFDALDEMPREDYGLRYGALKTFMTAWIEQGNRFIYSCRRLDYDPVFNVDEVLIEPFDRRRIRQFLRLHVPRRAKELYRHILADEALLDMVSNPFHLQALAYLNHGDGPLIIPTRRGQLVHAFVDLRLKLEAEDKQREALSWIEGGLPRVRTFLAELAFSLQQRRQAGTSVAIASLPDLWRRFPQWRQLLQVAWRAQILGKRDAPPPDQPMDWSTRKRLEFAHHRLQEVFAADALAGRLAEDDDLNVYLDDIWWHESLILALAAAPDTEERLRGMLEPRPDAHRWLEDVDGLLAATEPPDDDDKNNAVGADTDDTADTGVDAGGVSAADHHGAAR